MADSFLGLLQHCYYKKSLKDQQIFASKQIKELENLINEQERNSKEVLWLKYIEQGIEEYKRAGTPVKIIDTLNISQPEKAQIYEAVMKRIKGRSGKSNPYL